MATNNSITSGSTNENQLDFYWVGVNTEMPEGGRLLDSPISERFIDKKLAQHAFEQLKGKYSDAQICGWRSECRASAFLYQLEAIENEDSIYRKAHGL